MAEQLNHDLTFEEQVEAMMDVSEGYGAVKQYSTVQSNDVKKEIKMNVML